VIVRAGIDEAGLGPVLGPLTVGLVSFQVPVPATNLWEALSDAVSATPDRDRIVVCDSKRLFSQDKGVAPLERSLFPFLGVERGMSLAALLEVLSVPGREELARYPWYQSPPLTEVRLPLAADPDEITDRTDRLARSMRAAKVSFAGARARASEGYGYDAGSREFDGRFGWLSWLVGGLLSETAAAHARADVRVLAGKQGMRVQYESALHRAFPGAFLWVRDEQPHRSDYEIAREGAPVRIAFVRDGEDAFFEIALASLVAKYLREALMSRFRAWWVEKAPDVAETAGYGLDGKRFLAEVGPRLAGLGLPREAVERLR